MFAAISDRPDFYRDKLNLCVMLAPVMTVHNMECQKMQKMKDNERAV